MVPAMRFTEVMSAPPPEELLTWPAGEIQRMFLVNRIVLETEGWFTAGDIAAQFHDTLPESVTGILNLLVWLGKCERDGRRYRVLPD